MNTLQATSIAPALKQFPRITWLRNVEQDPRITGGPLDLAKVMAIGADKYGRCDLTIKQIQHRLVLRQEDGSYIPERTIKSWRTRLKKLGAMKDVAPGVGAGFAGPGKGKGGTWQLLLNGQSETSETGNETGNSIARSTVTPTGSAPPKGEPVTATAGGQVDGSQVDYSGFQPDEIFDLDQTPTAQSNPPVATTTPSAVVAPRGIPEPEPDLYELLGCSLG